MEIKEIIEAYILQNSLDESFEVNKDNSANIIEYAENEHSESLVWDSLNDCLIFESASIRYNNDLYTSEDNTYNLIMCNDEYFHEDDLSEFYIVYCEPDDCYAHTDNTLYGVIDRRGNEGYFLYSNEYVSCDGDYYLNYEVANSSNVYSCNCCGDYYHIDNPCCPEDDENEGYTFEYHSGNTSDFSREAIFRIGFEVEKEDLDIKKSILAQDLLDDTGWVKEKDSSLDDDSGFELVSPIFDLMDREFIIENLSRVESHLNAGYSKSCGGHINYSIEGKSSYNTLDSVKGYLPLLYAMYEHRLNNRFCKAKKAELLFNMHDKYQSVAIKDNRIEFRIFPAVKSMSHLIWRLDLITIFANNPRIQPEDVLKDMIDINSPLYLHLNKIFTSDQIKSKIELFIKYSLEIEELSLRYILTGEEKPVIKQPEVITTNDLKEGDIVRIRPTSRYYGECPQSNPAGINGTIVNAFDSGYPYNIQVKWDTGHTNSYNLEDLELMVVTETSNIPECPY